MLMMSPGEFSLKGPLLLSEPVAACGAEARGSTSLTLTALPAGLPTAMLEQPQGI